MLSINLTELSFDSSTTYTGRKLRLVVLLFSNAAVNENPLLQKKNHNERVDKMNLWKVVITSCSKKK